MPSLEPQCGQIKVFPKAFKGTKEDKQRATLGRETVEGCLLHFILIYTKIAVDT